MKLPSCQELESWVDDRLHPTVALELQQATRSPMLLCAYLVVLLLFYWVAMSYLWYSPEYGGHQESKTLPSNSNREHKTLSGRDLFSFLYFWLVFISHLALPFFSYSRHQGEDDQSNTKTLLLTGMSGRNCVWGKLQVNLILALVSYFAVAPFLVCSYFLGGIDLLAIIFALILSLFSLLTCINSMIALSSLLRGGLAVIVLPIAFILIWIMGETLFRSVNDMLRTAEYSGTWPNLNGLDGWIAHFAIWCFVFVYANVIAIGIALRVFSPGATKYV